MPSTLVLPCPLPADEVKIGSFLVNPGDPTQDYIVPQEKDPGLKPSILRVDVTDFTNTIRDAGNKEVEALLTSYFSITIDRAKSKSLELSSTKAATYLMRNSGYWFEQACELAPIRRWVEWVNRRGLKIYLLVGLRTIFDGRFRLEHTAATGTGGQVKVPTDILVGLPPMGLDVGGGGKVFKDQAALSEFNAAGERIWALQYRQIKFKWYSTKKMENAALESRTRWVTFNRSAHSRYIGTKSGGGIRIMPDSTPVSRDRSEDLSGDNIAGKTGSTPPSVKPPHPSSSAHYVYDCLAPLGESKEEPPSELLEKLAGERVEEPPEELDAESASEIEDESVRKRKKGSAGKLFDESSTVLLEETPEELDAPPASEIKSTPIDELTDEPLVEDTKYVVEAFIDDELDLEDQFDVQDTNGEMLFILNKAEVRERLWPPEMAGQTGRWATATPNQ